MTMPVSAADFLHLGYLSGILAQDALQGQERDSILAQSPERAADALVRRGVLTRFQAKLLLAGRHRGLRIGPYVILDQLGQGGMGAVYLAEDERQKRKVALKVLTASKDAFALKRFEREARATAALDHSSIVRLFDVSQHGEVPFLVMEYVDGRTMDQLLADSGRLPYAQVAWWAFQVALGLQRAHELGFVHRDIKPANLIVTEAGQVKILDMGLARSEETRDKLTEMMDKGAVVGTADYMSPEQALSGSCDTRADIYSLGATFYTLASGRPPFAGTLAQKLFAHQMTAAPSLADVVSGFPRELADVVAKMMAKAPADRFQTPGEAAAALAPWCAPYGTDVLPIYQSSEWSATGSATQSDAAETTSAGSVAETEPPPPSKNRRARLKRPTLWISIGAGVFVLGAIVAVLGPRGSSSDGSQRVTASATPPVVTGKTTSLSAEVDSDPGAGLTYVWSVVSGPTGAPAPTFSSNGTASARQTVATFARAGVYTLRVTVADPTGFSTTSDLAVPVVQTASTVRLTPTFRDVAPGSSIRFSADGSDQFDQPLAFTWSATAGQMRSDGLFTAPRAPQSVTVTAQGGGLTARAAVQVETVVPFAHWRLDDGAGSTVADATGKDRTGDVMGAVWTTDAKGRPRLHFDGATSNLKFATGPSLSGIVDFTLAAWVRTTATTRGVIVQQRDKSGFNGEYQLSVAADGTVRFMVFGNGNHQFDFGTTAAVNDGRWRHVTAVRQGTTGALYIDGVPTASATGTVRSLNGAIGVAVGVDLRDDVGHFNGDIADLRIYDAALIRTQVAALARRTPP